MPAFPSLLENQLNFHFDLPFSAHKKIYFQTSLFDIYSCNYVYKKYTEINQLLSNSAPTIRELAIFSKIPASGEGLYSEFKQLEVFFSFSITYIFSFSVFMFLFRVSEITKEK